MRWQVPNEGKTEIAYHDTCSPTTNTQPLSSQLFLRLLRRRISRVTILTAIHEPLFSPARTSPAHPHVTRLALDATQLPLTLRALVRNFPAFMPYPHLIDHDVPPCKPPPTAGGRSALRLRHMQILW
jgi:hypothetical protein